MSQIDNSTKPLIAVDFDGTLCNSNYPDCGSPFAGGKQALEKFRKLGYLILIYSCRSCHWHYDLYPNVKRETPVAERDTVVNMRKWLIEHDYPFDEIDDGSKGKPFADFYIDDRGITFANNWSSIEQRIEEHTLLQDAYKQYSIT